MPKIFDLHSHSCYSDGELTPADLVSRAVASGVDVLALTDHDTVAGIPEALAAAQQTKLQLIAGIELSATWCGCSIHIVGLNIDIQCQQLLQGTARHQQLRDERAIKIADRLLALGHKDVHQVVCERLKGRLISRVHFAEYLVNAGAVKDYAQAFKRYLARGKAAFVSAEWATLAEVVKWIQLAGGEAVLAHPTRYRLTASKLRQLITDFKTAGGLGLEVVTARTQQDEIQLIGSLCQEYSLLGSVGSDFHGPSTWAQLGRIQALPTHYQPIWHQWNME